MRFGVDVCHLNHRWTVILAKKHREDMKAITQSKTRRIAGASWE